jgi:hypothetical protein
MGGACSKDGRDEKYMYNILVAKSEGKRPTGRPRCGWEDNIRMELREIGWEGVDWIWLRIEKTGGPCEHGSEPSFPIKGGEFLD